MESKKKVKNIIEMTGGQMTTILCPISQVIITLLYISWH